MATTDALTLSISSDIGDVANFLTEWAKLGGDIIAVWDSPQMIQARNNVATQKRKDQNATDAGETLKTGNVTEVEKDLS